MSWILHVNSQATRLRRQPLVDGLMFWGNIVGSKLWIPSELIMPSILILRIIVNFWTWDILLIRLKIKNIFMQDIAHSDFGKLSLTLQKNSMTVN